MISVVVPLYNKGQYVERALRSVFAQSQQPLEIIVVDDGSTDDGIVRVLDLAHPHLRVIRQTNHGVSAARNAGVRAALSDLIAFIDADDEWYVEHLEEITALAAAFPNAAMVGTRYCRIDQNGRVSHLRYPDTGGTPRFLLNDYFDTAVRLGLPINSSSVAVRKTALLRCGGFPVGISMGEDFLTWARLACEGDVAYSTRCTSMYYAPDQRASHRRQNVCKPDIPDLVATDLASLTPRNIEQQDSLNRYVGLWHRMRAMSFLELGEVSHSLREIKLACSCSGLRMRDLGFVLLASVPGVLRDKLLEKKRKRKFA